MSRFRTPRNLALGAVGAGTAFFLFPRSASAVVPQDFNSVPGVKNIGDRYSAGGGSTTHLPAVATKRGSPESISSPQENAKGVDSSSFNALQADQKLGEPNALGKAWNQTQYGNEKGK